MLSIFEPWFSDFQWGKDVLTIPNIEGAGEFLLLVGMLVPADEPEAPKDPVVGPCMMKLHKYDGSYVGQSKKYKTHPTFAVVP